MTELERIEIDLKKNFIQLIYNTGIKPLIIHFNNQSRQFFFSLIALISIKMKNEKVNSIILSAPENINLLLKLDKWLLGKTTSKKDDNHKLMEKIRKAWTDQNKGLKNLRYAPRFNIVNRKKVKIYQDLEEIDTDSENMKVQKEYICKPYEYDIWFDIIGIKGKPKELNYRIAVDQVGITVENILLKYEEKFDQEAWQYYLNHTEKIYNRKSGFNLNFSSGSNNDYFFLTPAENTLQINPISKHYASPKFFRKSGPIYIDIKNDKVIMREEVGPIINFIKQKKSILVLGNVASGKTVLARMVATQWMEKKNHVFFLDLKKQREAIDLKKIIEEINHIISEAHKPLVIIEDAHLKPNQINTLLSKKKNDWPQIFITTRYSYRQKISKFEENYFETLEKIVLKTNETIDNIVNSFFEHKKWLLNEKLEIKVKEIANGNLWLLSYALRSLEKTNGIAIENNSILNEVYDDLCEIENENPIYARLLIALSVLYRFEIPTDIRFLYELFSVSRDTLAIAINELCKMGEVVINDTQRFHCLYGLPHSALAELYFHFSEDSKWQYDGFDSFEMDFVSSYFVSRQSKNWMQLIRGNYLPQKYKKNMLSAIVNTENKKQYLVKKIYKSAGLNEIGICIEESFHISENLGYELWQTLDKDVLVQKLLNSNRIYECEKFIKDIGSGFRPAAEELCQKIGIEKFVQKIEVWEDNFLDIGDCIYTINNFYSKVGKKICEKLNTDRFVKKIGDLDFPFYAPRCIDNIFSSNRQVAYEICEKLNITRLVKKLNESGDIVFNTNWLKSIYKANEEAGKVLCREIDIDSMSKKIDDMEDIENTAPYIKTIFQISNKLGNKLWLSLNKDALAEKIVKTFTPSDSQSYLEIISEASRENGIDLSNRLNWSLFTEKLNELDDPLKIINSLIYFFQASNTFGSNIWKGISKLKLSEKIIELRDIDDIALVLAKLHTANKEAATELWQCLDQRQLAIKVRETEKLYHTGVLIEVVYKISEKAGISFISLVDQNIIIEKVIDRYEQFGAIFLLQIAFKFSKKFETAFLMERIQRKLIEKLFQLENISELGECIEETFNISQKVGDDMWKEINKAHLIEKILGADQTNDSAVCIARIFKGSKKAGEELWQKIDKKYLAKKICNKALAPGRDINIIFTASKKAGGELWENVDQKVLANYILTKDPYDIRACIEMINHVSEKASIEISESLDQNKLVDKIVESVDIPNALMCIRKVNDASKNVGEQLRKNIHWPLFLTKVIESENLNNVVDCIDTLIELCNGSNPHLYEGIDVIKLSKKINDSDDLFNIGKCINLIFKTNSRFGKKLWKNIDISKLTGKILDPNDRSYATKCVRFICQASGDSGRSLIDCLGEDKIIEILNTSDDVFFTLEFYLKSICYVSMEKGYKIWLKIDKPRFTKKIYAYEYFYQIGYFLYEIFNASTKIGYDLWLTIDKKELINKMDVRKEPNEAHEVVECLGCIFRASEVAGKEIWYNIDKDVFATNLDNSSLTSSGLCIKNMIRSSNEIGNELLKLVKKDKLIKKIDQSKDVYSIGLHFRSLFQASMAFGNDIFKRINITVLAQKIIENKHSGKARKSIEFFFEGSKEAGKELIDIIFKNSPEIAKWNFEKYQKF